VGQNPDFFFYFLAYSYQLREKRAGLRNHHVAGIGFSVSFRSTLKPFY